MTPADRMGDADAGADGTAWGGSDAVGTRVSDMVERARAAQPAWAALSVRERGSILRRLARALHERSAEIVDAIRADTGKPRVEALAEVVVSVDLVRFIVRRAPRALRARSVGAGWMVWKSGRVEREPWGVVGAITAWNYPFILPMDTVVPALAAGNAVIVKPSELTPAAARVVADLCAGAGVPEGLAQVLEGDGEVGAALVTGDIDRIVFTGGTETGRRVMRGAAERLVPVTLELGGKDAALVLDDADVDRAARGVVFGAFFNAGQTCLSVERAFVHERVYDAFVTRVAELAGSLRTGEGDIDLGRVIAPPQADVLRRQVDDALERGARCLTGGPPTDAEPLAWPATVLVDVDDDMAVMNEESFGPLLPIARVSSDAEAVRRANATPFGLFASVWTDDRARGLRVARRLRAGGVSVNDVLSHYGAPALPMGGVGDSGFGRRRGEESLLEMSRTRTILTNRWARGGEPWWYPYGPAKERLFEATLAWRGLGGARGLAAGARALLGGGR